MTLKDPHRVARQDRLLAHYRNHPDRNIRTGTVRELYDAWGFGPKRSTAKRDIRDLEHRGRIVGRGPENRRRYRLAR